MIAFDTNMFVRLCLNDDPAQTQTVKQLLKSVNAFSTPVTVMLELVWVLESKRVQRADIAQYLMRICALPNFFSEDSDALENAVEAYEQGLDFADALHLALSSSFETLLTFDRAFVKKAKQHKLAPPVMLAQ